jgi:hypothetical protein
MEIKRTMNTQLSTKWQALLLLAVLFLASCSSPLGAPPATPTVDAQAITSTVAAVQTEAVQTAYDELTQTAAAAPTDTPTPQPTDTPLPTETPVPTLAPVLPTATFAPPPTQKPTSSPTQGAYQCSITSLSPAAGTSITKGSDFDLNVTLKNVGTSKWDDNNIDFKYISGSEFQKKTDAVDLSTTVAPDDTVNLIVDMVANTDTGTHSATWGLVQSGASFCNVTISINVK